MGFVDEGRALVARSMGGDLELIERRFNDLAGPLVDRGQVAFEAMNRVETLAQCHLVEVTTDHGVGVVETLVFRGKPTISFLGAPRQADRQIEFEPTTNLAQLLRASLMPSTPRASSSPARSVKTSSRPHRSAKRQLVRTSPWPVV